MKQYPEYIHVFMSPEMKIELVEWCKKNRIPLTEAGRVAIKLFLEKYRDHNFGADFP